MNPSLKFHLNSALLEGPVYDHKENLLYFVSILNYLDFCYNPSSRKILSKKVDFPNSCIFFVDSKRIIVASKNGFIAVDFNTLQKHFSFQIDIANSVLYNNENKDPLGKFIRGTIECTEVKENIGKVFSYLEGKYKMISEDTTISDGLAFSHYSLNLYFFDTHTKKVPKYACDKKVGNVSFESYVKELNPEESPDDKYMDNMGMLWNAEWGGGRISRWNPENGPKTDEQKLPSPNVTFYCLEKHLNLYLSTAKSFDKYDMSEVGFFMLN